MELDHNYQNAYLGSAHDTSLHRSIIGLFTQLRGDAGHKTIRDT